MIPEYTQWEIEDDFYNFINKLKDKFSELDSGDFIDILEPLIRSI